MFMFIPIGAKHLKSSYLRRTSDVLPNTRTDIVVTYAHQTDGVGSIVGQTAGIDFLRELITGDELEGDRQMVIDQLVHATLYFLFFLTRGLMIDMKAHLALLTLDMSIERALAAEESDHRLVQQMLRRMCRGELFLVVFV